MTTKDKILRDKLIRKWQCRLGLNGWRIYVIEETKKVMTKNGKMPNMRGDMFPYPNKKVGFIRHNTWSSIEKEKREEVLVHELLHFVFPEDSEKTVGIMAEVAVRDYESFKRTNDNIELEYKKRLLKSRLLKRRSKDQPQPKPHHKYL